MGKFSRLGNALYEGDVSVDFVGRKWLWYAVSGVIVLLAASGLFVKSLNLGIEFEGGVEYSVSLPSNQVTQENVDAIRDAVADAGIDDASSPVVNTSGNEAIRVLTEPLSSEDVETVTGIIEETVPDNSGISTSEIGASWGQQIAEKALTGIGVFIVLVALFIWAYFREWKMSVAALVALAHDVIITVGIYAWSGFEVTPSTVTGILTILGFSLYDTVVVFDKVKENTRDLRKAKTTYAKAANLAVNQTLVRSINTSIVALLPVAAILYIGVALLGAGSLKDLALSLFVGMAAGLYSSVFIATPLAVHLKSREREVTEADRLEKARARNAADRYAAVPTFSEDMPLHDEAGDADRPTRRPDTPEEPAAPRAERKPEKMGSGRVVPESKGPVADSGAAKRQQPSRKTRSRRTGR
ncbi:protein translocase subunit SecF [Alteromonas gracilis]